MPELGDGTGQDRAPVFHHQAPLGGLERQGGVLLNQENAEALIPEPQQYPEDRADQDRRQSHRRLVEHQQPWL